MAVRLPAGPAVAGALRRTWAAGDAALPLDPALPEPALDRLLRELRPHVLLDGSGERALPDPAPVADGTALVVTTSGSTGPPKAVVLSRAALEASARASLDRLAEIGVDPRARWLCCLPLHHVAGVAVLVRAEFGGGGVEVHARFDVAAVAAADAQCVSLVPTQLRRLLAAGVDLRRFAAVLLGGAAVPPALLERAEAAGARVVRTYGMTETCGGCVYDGTPLAGVEVAVTDDEHLAVRGPVLFDAYRLDPERTAAVLRDGWFHTDDLGRWRPDGRLEVLGRRDDVVVSGGENVPGLAVAAILATHPDVAEAAVVGRPDGEWGEVAVAVVVPRAREHPPALEALRAHVRAEAPAAWAPRDLVVVDELPARGPGKADREALRRLAARDRTR